MYEGRITFPTEIVYLNYIRRLHYEIPGADETLRSFESRDRFRQLKSVGIVGFFFFLKKPQPTKMFVIRLIESPLGFSQKSTIVAVQRRCNQLQYPLL